MKKFLLFVALFNFALTTYAASAKLTDIKIYSANDTRIVFSLTQPVVHKAFTLSNPLRLVVDLKNTRLATSLNNLSLTQTTIKNIRIGYPAPNVTRIVFDLNAHTPLNPVTTQTQSAITVSLRNTTVATHNLPVVKKESAKRQRPLVVVIDPGHGGHDPGAVGANGTKEKNVTLAISKRLAYFINQQPNMRAVLTRNGDYFVDLRGRLKLARKGNADLFVALHADSYFNNQAKGASVYALSQHGATTEAARWLARRDNYSELGGVDLRELGDQSYLLRSVLIDLAQTATITDSLRLGKIMLSDLRAVTRLHYTRVEQAPFMVLKSPDIPSVLVEMGFISNEGEEENLRDERYQNKMALALFNGIRSYLQKYPMVNV